MTHGASINSPNDMLFYIPHNNIGSIIHILFFHTALVSSWPITHGTHHESTHQIETRTAQAAHTINKRLDIQINSSVIGGIAGGAIALIAIALIIGLGAASIAISGSLEWNEWRGKKMPEEAGARKGPPDSDDSDSDSDSDSLNWEKEEKLQLEFRDGQEKRPPVPPKMEEPAPVYEKSSTGQGGGKSRLTIKSFLPMDFNPTWIAKTKS